MGYMREWNVLPRELLMSMTKNVKLFKSRIKCNNDRNLLLRVRRRDGKSKGLLVKVGS